MPMDYVRIGKITGTQGLKGKVVMRHDLPDFNALRKLGHIFIGLQKGSYIPYFTEQWQQLNTEEVALLIEGIQSPESAAYLLGKETYVEAEVFVRLAPTTVTVDFTGFMVKDKFLGSLGIIRELMESPGQVIASVDYKGKEVLLPLVDQTIVSIDVPSRTILMNLPSGLLDVYIDPVETE